jgi:hypothetical protein
MRLFTVPRGKPFFSAISRWDKPSVKGLLEERQLLFWKLRQHNPDAFFLLLGA